MVMNIFGKRNFMHPKEGSACTLMIGLVLSFRKGYGERDFLFFFLMFSKCSHQVPHNVLKVFSNAFPIMFPICTWALSHMVCLKFNSHVYNLKR
jgi:hypothetical protein